MNKELQTKLDSLGNTPFDEPKIYEALTAKVVKKSVVIEATGIDSSKYLAMDVAKFYRAVHDRILDCKLEDGNYKITEATSDFKLPSFTQVEEVIELMDKMKVLKKEQEIIQGEAEDSKDIDAKKLKKTIKALTALFEKLDAITWEITGLDKKDLTPWEQSLIAKQVFACITDV